MQTQSEESKIKFPRIDRHLAKEGVNTNSYTKNSLTNICDNDIAEAVHKALKKAKSMITTLGMAEILQEFNKWDCFTIHSTDDNNEDEDETDDDDDEEDTGTCNANNDAVSSAVIQEVCSVDQTEIEGDIGVMLKALTSTVHAWNL